MHKAIKFGKCSNCADKPVQVVKCGPAQLCVACAEKYIARRADPRLPVVKHGAETGHVYAQRRTVRAQ